MPQEPKDSENNPRNKFIYMTLGFELVGIIVASIYLGQWIEKKYPKGGLIITGLIFCGFAVWFYRLIRIQKKLK